MTSYRPPGLLAYDLTSVCLFPVLARWISAVIFVAVSCVTTSPSEQQVQEFTFHHDTMERQSELGWWQDYRLYSLILVLLATALVVAHW